MGRSLTITSIQAQHLEAIFNTQMQKKKKKNTVFLLKGPQFMNNFHLYSDAALN